MVLQQLKRPACLLVPGACEQRDGVRADIVTYNTLIAITAKAGRLEETMELLRKASEDSGVEFDVVRSSLAWLSLPTGVPKNTPKSFASVVVRVQALFIILRYSTTSYGDVQYLWSCTRIDEDL